MIVTAWVQFVPPSLFFSGEPADLIYFGAKIGLRAATVLPMLPDEIKELIDQGT